MKSLILTAMIGLGLSGCAPLQGVQDRIQGHLDRFSSYEQPDRCGEGNAWRYYPECDSYKAHVKDQQRIQAANEQNELVLERRRVADVKAAKLQAMAEKKQAIIDAKDARARDVQGEKEQANYEKMMKEGRTLYAAQEKARLAAMTPKERADEKAAAKAAMEELFRRNLAAADHYNRTRFDQLSRESSARQLAQRERNVFCHRNFGRSC